MQAKLYFYNKEYDKSFELFESILTSKEKTNIILPNIQDESAQFLFAIAMISAPQMLDKSIEYVKNNCDEITAKVFSQCLNIYYGNEQNIFTENDDCDLILTAISTLFDKILKAKEFELFEKLLYIYNNLNCRSVLISLAEIYRNNEYYKLAAEQVLRSVKELDYINFSGIDILAKARFLS